MNFPNRIAIRRNVRFPCVLLCDAWEQSRTMDATDVSSHGLFIPTDDPLPVGTTLIASFAPPAWERGQPMTCIAEVARITLQRRQRDLTSLGMGLRFTELDYDELEALERTLRGVPPRMSRRRKRRATQEWVEVKTIWEEALDDRINIFEEIDLVPVFETEFEPVAESELVSA